MILVDTSIWIDHFRRSDPWLVSVLERDEALSHPFVVGELALGSLRDGSVLEALAGLPSLRVESDFDVLAFIAGNDLAGSGIGYVDAHLLAAAGRIGARVGTRDRRLQIVASRLGLGASLA